MKAICLSGDRKGQDNKCLSPKDSSTTPSFFFMPLHQKKYSMVERKTFGRRARFMAS